MTVVVLILGGLSYEVVLQQGSLYFAGIRTVSFPCIPGFWIFLLRPVLRIPGNECACTVHSNCAF